MQWALNRNAALETFFIELLSSLSSVIEKFRMAGMYSTLLFSSAIFAGLFMLVGWIGQLIFQAHSFELIKTYHAIS